MAEMKKPLPPSSTPHIVRKVERKPQVLHMTHEEEEEGETEESGESETDEGSDEESDSETTLTDSGSEETGSKGDHPKSLRLSIDSTHHSDSLQSPLDIFLSAAEALSNTVPVEIALHDHTYPRPPMDLQGSTGLQLIAAAAAVVSPGLSKTTSSSNKSAFTISNKAPRGRPPSQQKRGSNYSQKLAPTFLTPTSGTSHNILLQDLKPSLRARSRSAPTEKTRPIVPPPPPPSKSLPYPQSNAAVKGNSRGLSSYRSGAPVCNKDINLIASGVLKSSTSIISNGHSSNLLDSVGGLHSLHDGSQSVNSSVLSYPLVTSTSTGTGSKTQRKEGTVLELNLGNMALLLAATGNNQQAALLLPQSTLLNKQALAMLQSGSVCLSDSGATATINIDPSILGNSNGRLTKTPADTCTISKETPPSVNKVYNHPVVSVSCNSTHFTTATTKDSEPLPVAKQPVPPTTLSSVLETTDSSLQKHGVPPPSSSDLSNLNLLSNLVAGLSKKSNNSQSSPPVVAQSMTPPTKPPSLNFRKTSEKQDSRKPADPVHRVGSISTSSPSSYPTTISSQQQSLMLYARSLAMPLNSPSAHSPEDEDHLEYATRGISELSKLLGGADNGLETPPSKVQWSPDDLLCNPYNDSAPPTSVHTITSSLMATDFLAPPTTHQIPLSTRTSTPINALMEDNS